MIGHFAGGQPKASNSSLQTTGEHAGLRVTSLPDLPEHEVNFKVLRGQRTWIISCGPILPGKSREDACTDMLALGL